MGDLVQAVSPAQDEKARAAFEAAVATLTALGAPLEQAVATRRPAVEAANQAIKELELALKADVSNALAVTLTFVGGDGD